MNLLKKLFGARPAVNFKELKEKGAMIIDVRTPEEFQSGHIKEAINMPSSTISNLLNKIRQKHKPVIAVCRSGSRSNIAVGILKKAGVEAYNGGAWNVLQRKIT